ncbi:3,4-dihydroxy-2-butanone-4-phosphate synthase [Granulicoccus sp. GXG6511]|uniref:3,4-dihydroxy-2-butanone-4-phosphate synthase n=1 Tax=Granulicoccus sp. GXG6511 TaxID=3381351 RepID=UPI003D7ED6A0
MNIAPIEDALSALRTGRPVLVLDDADRENEGDVILAAETLTDAWVAWTIRHTSGYLCAPLPEATADVLRLPLMVTDNEDRLRTAYTITVDAAAGITTGISAADRARTLRVLADPTTTPGDLIRPGHVVPLRARGGGVFTRRGHTEAAVDLCRLAGLAPVGAIAELVSEDGSMLRTPGVLALGAEHDLPVITIADLVSWRDRHDRVRRGASGSLPTRAGEFSATAYADLRTGADHLVLVSPHGLTGDPVVRVHSECLTGDAFGSARCDCGPQLDDALERIAREPGAVIYLRGHEGRGVGLANKLAAYERQDSGLDTIDAQLALGLPVDAREYAAAVAILDDLGIDRLRLLTNNPSKLTTLAEAGFAVTRMPSQVGATAHNRAYLDTKRDRLGHLLAIPDNGLRARKGA